MGRWPRFLSFLSTLGWGQLLLLFIGCAALLLGAMTAWRAEASTTLLIVGAVLLLAAFVLGPELGELRLRHGETELFARYRAGVQEALATSTTPEELVARVEQLEAAAKEAEAAKAFENVRKRALRVIGETMRREDVALQPGEAKAAASVLGDTAFLTLRARAAAPSGAFFHSAECHVIDPKGRPASAVATSTLGGIASVRRFSLTYPREFPDAQPLEPGTYKAEWRQRPLLPTIASTLSPRPVVATTTFEVPGTT
jgi:hypothetical protein